MVIFSLFIYEENIVFIILKVHPLPFKEETSKQFYISQLSSVSAFRST